MPTAITLTSKKYGRGTNTDTSSRDAIYKTCAVIVTIFEKLVTPPDATFAQHTFPGAVNETRSGQFRMG
jgi:hypothetical protein